MDHVDLEILRRLSRNSRLPYSDIADELGIATSTVLNRVKKLRREGVIERFTLQLDPSKVGKGITTYVGINIEQEKKERVIELIKKIEDVVEIYELLEPYDIFIKVCTKDVDTLKENILRVISRIDGVLEQSSILTTRRHKEVMCNP
jgi:Lrp/AsnC family transcriptional regulator for asnA, asnC and gidA